MTDRCDKLLLGELSHLKILIFDVDDTLCSAKSNISSEMADLLQRSLQKYKVILISGSPFDSIRHRVVNQLELCTEPIHMERLTIMPIHGTEVYRFSNDHWHMDSNVVANSCKQRLAIMSAIHHTLEKYCVWNEYSPQLFERGNLFALSLAPFLSAEDRAKLGPEGIGEIREKIAQSIMEFYPECDATVGGKTTVDIMPLGMDKASSIKRLLSQPEFANLSLNNIRYFGDKLKPMGNDYSMLKAGFKCISVINPADTEAKLKNILEKY